MRILVSNDDGIDFPGIHAIATALKKLGQVTVVAPATQQTSKGHSATYGAPYKTERYDFGDDDIEAYRLWGTPKDCMDIALKAMLREKPDLVVTGINEGVNVCNDNVTSGTVGGASAAFLNGIPAVAVSLGYGDSYDYMTVVVIPEHEVSCVFF